ncbi:MAG: hypothetical protein J6X39_03635 [Bacteroidales bacterium]|nr:hypothetical protein [Bacteroidales bacterium]
MADYRRKVSLELDSNAERQVRELINEYSNSISNHPFQDLGDKIKIKVYDRCNIYIPQVKTEFDQRTVSEQKKPYDGRSVSARTVMTLAAVDPWSFDLLNTDSFTNQQKEFIVSGSQHVEPCSKCGRKGTMICYDCHGLGEKTCSKCDEGTVTCSECRGAGKTKCPRCVLPFVVKTNDPDWSMYNALPITQCVIFLFALWFVRMKLLRKDYSSLRYGTVWGFLGAGMLKVLLPALGVLAGLLVLNYLGLSLFTTDILWIIIIAWIVILIRSKKKK